MTETRLNFKETRARFDATPRTLRHYEYIELLQPGKDGRALFRAKGNCPHDADPAWPLLWLQPGRNLPMTADP